MEPKPEWREFVDRAGQFHWNVELIKNQIVGNEIFFRNLYSFKNNIVDELDETGNLSEKQVLKKVFSEIYNFTIRSDEQFIIFAEGVDPFVQGVYVHESVYEACFFTVLCMFLHDTKRIDGKSLRRFVYDNSLEYYNDKKSPNYFPFDSSSSDKLLNEESTLRKTRNRRLSDRPVYNKRTEWSAMSKDSEHEWTYYYILEVIGDEEKDTFKRINVLYNDIKKVIKTDGDGGYEIRLEKAYKKFLSKLKKLKYENYLKLQESILEHIYENGNYYGMNIYRFEKELKFYLVTYEIKCLLDCKDGDEEKDILVKSIILKDIHYPKVYKDFASFSDLPLIQNYTQVFNKFRYMIIISFYLVMDEVIEKGYLGENWEKLFLDMINGMTENVFYDPKKIDYTVAPGSQERFMEILDAPVRSLLRLPI